MSTLSLSVCQHPLLCARGFVTEFPSPLASMPSPDWLKSGLSLSASVPLSSSDALRQAVRDLLRHGGYKPTGRGKPASEYLLRAASEGGLGSINLAVDACNVVSLHSGIPVSVVDLGRAKPPLSIRIGAAGETYVFNASGQTIDIAGLLVLCDAEGPCANAVKDAQRTKTHDGTSQTLSILWGCTSEREQTSRALDYYLELLHKLGAKTQVVL